MPGCVLLPFYDFIIVTSTNRIYKKYPIKAKKGGKSCPLLLLLCNVWIARAAIKAELGVVRGCQN
jgi:hypothetical protein